VLYLSDLIIWNKNPLLGIGLVVFGYEDCAGLTWTFASYNI